VKHDMGDEKTIKEIIAEVDTDNVNSFSVFLLYLTPKKIQLPVIQCVGKTTNLKYSCLYKFSPAICLCNVRPVLFIILFFSLFS
jgi:hypothetical protein